MRIILIRFIFSDTLVSEVLKSLSGEFCDTAAIEYAEIVATHENLIVIKFESPPSDFLSRIKNLLEEARSKVPSPGRFEFHVTDLIQEHVTRVV